MTEVTKTPSIINRCAVKAFALGCSAQRRAGKFTRVGQSFIDEVEADLEAAIRQISGAPLDDALPTDLTFTTGEAGRKLRERFEALAAKIIQSKVQRQPSVGQTLQNTR